MLRWCSGRKVTGGSNRRQTDARNAPLKTECGAPGIWAPAGGPPVDHYGAVILSCAASRRTAPVASQRPALHVAYPGTAVRRSSTVGNQNSRRADSRCHERNVLPSASMVVLAAGTGYFLAFVVVMFFAVVFGLYTRRGSAIDQHPDDGLDGAPGAKTPDGVAGSSLADEPEPDRDMFSEHGTR